MRATDRPASAKKIGNRPHARPSLRLLTSPACDADDSAFSRNEEREDLAGGELVVEGVVGGDVVGGFVAGGRGSRGRTGPRSRVRGRRRRGPGRTERAQAVLLGDVAGGECRDRHGAVAGGLVEAHRQAACLAGPTRSIFMITVVDHVRPWLTPSSTLANTTQPTSAPTSAAAGGRRRASRRRGPVCGRSDPTGCSEGVGAALTIPKAAMNVSAAVNLVSPNSSSASSGRTVRLADHAANEGVDTDQQRELGQVLRQPEPNRPRCRGGRAHRPTASG